MTNVERVNLVDCDGVTQRVSVESILIAKAILSLPPEQSDAAIRFVEMLIERDKQRESISRNPSLE